MKASGNATNAYWAALILGGPTLVGDCYSGSLSNSTGNPSSTNSVYLEDAGDPSETTNGPCVVYDGTTGHIVAYDEGTEPTVACTGASCAAGTRDTNASDNRWTLTGVNIPSSGTLTITFGAAFNWDPSCDLAVHVALTEQPYISAQGTSGSTYTSITWTFPTATGSGATVQGKCL